MKRVIFNISFVLISLLAVSQTYEVTVSGFITDIDDGSPVPNHEVTISTDSIYGSFNYYNTVFTDSSGFYSDLFNANTGDNGMVLVSTYGCGVYLEDTISYSQSNTSLTIDFAICEDSTSSECQAMFLAYPDSNNLMTYYFQDISTTPSGAISSWYWNFGDSITSTLQNPIHTYSEDGEYLVCLTINDSVNMCESTYCQLVRAGNWFPDCEAQFYYFPIDSMNPGNGDTLTSEIQFIDVSTGNPDSWYWDFGDGQTSSQQNPIHIFDNQGIYNVCLSIFNNVDSCESTYCEIIEVNNDTLPIGCNTWFNYEITNLTVNLNAFTEGNNGAVTYDWDFGDGTTATGQQTTHTYLESGYYEIELSSHDSADCYSFYSVALWVGEFSFDVSGFVYLDDSMMIADVATVYLMAFDTLSNGLISIDTTFLNTTGEYEFNDIEVGDNCMYFVQAELTEQSAYYGLYVPTYHLNALNWEDALPVIPLIYGGRYDIYMIPATSSYSGIGNISGMVNQENSREQLENIEIILLNEDFKPLLYNKTNELGNFDFSQLDYGTYYVYTEVVGVITNPVQISITEDNYEQIINIVISNGEAALNIEEQQSSYIEDIGEVYPNPVFENAYMTLSISKPSTTNIKIINQYGQIVYNKSVEYGKGDHIFNIDTQSYSNGIYVIKVTSEDNLVTVRKFLKLR